MPHNTLPHWYIYGAGGLGVETMDILQHAIREGLVPQHTSSFVEDATEGGEVLGYRVHDLSDCLPGSKVTIAVGEPRIRQLLMGKAQGAGLQLSSVISPTAFVSPMAYIGDGVIVGPLCSIQARANVAMNVAINTMAIVGHDVHVQQGAVLSSMVNLGGAAVIGEYAYVGMAALVKEGCSIGSWSIISMGSVVYNDLPEEVIAVGNPARVSRRNENKQVFK